MTFDKACELVWYWQHGGDSFNCQLYSLMQHADTDNMRALTRAFPVQAQAWLGWYMSSDPNAWFDEHVPPDRRHKG